MSNTGSPHGTAWQAISRAYTKGRLRIDTALKLENLPPLEVFEALSAIEAGTQTAKALETDLLLPQYAVSRLLDRMETDMLISRLPNRTDQRSKTLGITLRGRSVMQEQGRILDKALSDFFASRAKPGQLDRMTALLTLLDRETDEL